MIPFDRRASIRKKTKDVTGYCPHCGKPIKIGEKLCSYCKKNPNMASNPDKAIVKDKECPKCKSLNASDSIICASCGVNYIAYEMSQPPDLKGLGSLRKRKRT